MSKRRKLFIGITLFWLTIYLVSFVSWGMGYWSFVSESNIVLLHLSSMVLSFALIIFFSVHINNNDKLSIHRKAAWIVFTLFSGVIAMIAYYVRWMLPERMK